MKTKSSYLLALLTLTALACNSFIALPGATLDTGPSQTFSIEEALPDGFTASQAEFALAPGAASLALAGGARGLAAGQVEYNVAEWTPVVSAADGVLRIEQSLPEDKIVSAPKDAVNQWDVTLGADVSNVSIEFPAGAYTLTLDGSLPDGSQVSIQAGAVTLRLVVPATAAVSVNVHRGPSSVETEGAWTVTGGTYTTGGSGPTWQIRLDAGVGSLTLVAE